MEVKTSHYFYKEKGDRLAMDYLYFKPFNKRKMTELVPHDQQNTGNNLGWLFDNRADLLLTFNPVSLTAYIIADFNKLVANVLEDVENYVNSLEGGEMEWYENGYENKINEYLEGSVKSDRSLKESLIVNLKLTKEAIEHYEGIFKGIINIDLYVDNVPLEEYRHNLELEREGRTVRRRRGDNNPDDLHVKRRSRNSDDLHVKRRSSIMDKPKEENPPTQRRRRS